LGLHLLGQQSWRKSEQWKEKQAHTLAEHLMKKECWFRLAAKSGLGVGTRTPAVADI
jgi:hypothetical protein